MIKRVTDVTTASIGIVLASPIFIATGYLVAIKIGKPVIFKQTRVGKDNQLFDLYKFRTMTNETDGEGNLLPNEERHTKTGRMLRKYSLDELPQLINVIKGDISLVGPRPLLVDYLPLYNARQSRRHEVKPGITGWAQVNGRNSISWQEKFELDIWYVENRSMLLDLYIIYLTIIKVFKSEGVNSTGTVTMRRFEGNTENG
ncbi:sugar transferase [Salinicoccus roseus]|uniref:Sugar transferase n=1 Tax=Salinicoccus roseus TaxID=45670 RepID=A0A0C2HID8_9STAP|nr:sugar transferase [Salinicoccus roseus]KIH71419.1 sugar transferase [Salinicoccus roseus]MDB0579478.1 sugar transferase [Salinicoccus roseus]